MKPQRASAFADAVPLDGRGHSKPAMVLTLAVRDHLLREARRRFCIGISDRQAARQLHTALTRYQAGRWRRSRVDVTCPHQGEQIDALLWTILKVRDVIPSERSIRRILSFRGPPDTSGCAIATEQTT